MAVEIYVWPPHTGANGSNDIGHAAMKVDGGSPPGTVYLSRWPGLSLASIFLIGGGSQHTYEDDVSDEGGPPLVVRLTKLDETAIKSAVAVSNRVNMYSFIYLNCATNVGLCLRHGVPLETVSAIVNIVIGPCNGAEAAKYPTISTPWNLFMYAQYLHLAYA